MLLNVRNELSAMSCCRVKHGGVCTEGPSGIPRDYPALYNPTVRNPGMEPEIL